MNMFSRMAGLPRGAALLVAVSMLALYAAGAGAADVKVTLSGKQEVPPVKTKASGSGTISIGADKSVQGSISTKNIAATAAHIHEGAAGQNGPVIIPLTRGGDDSWKVPPDAKLTDEQYAAFEAGKLYVNVHTQHYPGGEIRAQLKP